MSRLLWVLLGGALGSGARYLVSLWTVRSFGAGLPYGTLAVNLLGSFLIGFSIPALEASERVSPEVRTGLVVGVLGGFTTYSTFSFESVGFFLEGEWKLGLLVVAATTLGCLLACALGFAAARSLGLG